MLDGGRKRLAMVGAIVCIVAVAWFKTSRGGTQAGVEGVEQKADASLIYKQGRTANCGGCRCSCDWATDARVTYNERCSRNDGSCCWACCCGQVKDDIPVYSVGGIAWAHNATKCLQHDQSSGALHMTDCTGWPDEMWIVPHLGQLRWKLNFSLCVTVPSNHEDPGHYLRLSDCLEDKPKETSGGLWSGANNSKALEAQWIQDTEQQRWLLPPHGQGPIRWAAHPDRCVNVGGWNRQGEDLGARARLTPCSLESELVHPDSLFLIPWVSVGDPFPSKVRGHYGYLTEFSVPTSLIQDRIDRMFELFNIFEFQFFFAFEGYSGPPPSTSETWRCVAGGRPVNATVLKAATKAIYDKGGRSWMYVHAHATDVGDHELQEGFFRADAEDVARKVHTHYFETMGDAGGATRGLVEMQAYHPDHPLIPDHPKTMENVCQCSVPPGLMGAEGASPSSPLDVVNLSPAWAIRFVPRWAKFARSMGFSGIHWDTFGDLGNFNNTDIPGFLRAALPYLQQERLEQTLNFVDGFGWDPALAQTGHIIAFAYWEVWTNPTAEDEFYRATEGSSAVIVCYPGWGQYHCCAFNERQNAEAYGLWPVDLGIARWQRATSHGKTYMFIGDGTRHLQGPFLPDARQLSEGDIMKVQNQVKLQQPVNFQGQWASDRWVPPPIAPPAPAPSTEWKGPWG